eukprot:SAG31_NODE_3977_length_3702_cov_1.536775_2_plen_282_part_00
MDAGAFHGAEVPFVLFDTFELSGSEIETAATMATFWTNFAATGDPNLAFPLDTANDTDLGKEDGRAPLYRRRVQLKVRPDEDSELPEQCGAYRGLMGVQAGWLNGTIYQTLRLSGMDACCKACSHIFYNRLCQGWRWSAASKTCELLSGPDVQVVNRSVAAGVTTAGIRVVPLPPHNIRLPPTCPPPPPPGTPFGPAAGGFPANPDVGVHEPAGLWPRYGAQHGGDQAMRFTTCNSSAVLHPREHQCNFWDQYSCVLKDCFKGIVIQGECDTAQLACTLKD